MINGFGALFVRHGFECVIGVVYHGRYNSSNSVPAAGYVESRILQNRFL